MEEIRKQFMSLVNKKIITLDNKCFICGDTKNLQLHHIIPLSNGGDNRPTNIITLCGQCHGKVHNNQGLKLAREKIAEKKKGDYILIDNQTQKEYFCTGWEQVAKILTILNKKPNYQYSKKSQVIEISTRTASSKFSKIKTQYPERLVSTTRGILIKDFMYRGNVDLIVKNTRRKDGINE